MRKVEGKTFNVVQDNIEKLKQLFPEVLTEDKIDIEKLRIALGENVEREKERYEFTWNGKTEAIKLAQKQTTGTLIPFKEESINWENSNNLYIEGDNLEILRVLQSSYRNKVKMIYIDPPYNTGNDFIYKDDYYDNVKNYLNQSEQTMKSNPETNGRFHTDWLNMMYPRLKIARNLLKEDGSIFISIGDNEQANLKFICDEIFGEECFVTTIHVEMSATQGMKVKAAKNGNIVKNSEYIFVYSKDGRKNIAENILYDFREKYDTHYSKILNENNEIEDLTSYMFSKDKSIKEEVDYFNKQLGKKLNLQEMYDYSVKFRGFIDEYKHKIFAFDKVTGFTEKDLPVGKVTEIKRNGKVYTLYNNGDTIKQLLLLSASFGKCDDFNESYGLRKIRGDWWKDFYKDMGNVSKEGEMKFENGKKPIRLIKQLIKMATNSNDIVLDFFSGSATTAHAVMELNVEEDSNRKFILVQLPEEVPVNSSYYNEGLRTICDIGRERIRRAAKQLIKDNSKEVDYGFKVFKLSDTNLKLWDEESIDLEKDLMDLIEPVKKGRTQEDVVYEILLKYGIDLTVPIETKEVAETTLYSVGMDYLLICLDSNLSIVQIEQIAKLKPARIVFYDEGFRDDKVRTNAQQILKRYGVEDIRVI